MPAKNENSGRVAARVQQRLPAFALAAANGAVTALRSRAANIDRLGLLPYLIEYGLLEGTSAGLSLIVHSGEHASFWRRRAIRMCPVQFAALTGIPTPTPNAVTQKTSTAPSFLIIRSVVLQPRLAGPSTLPLFRHTP